MKVFVCISSLWRVVVVYNTLSLKYVHINRSLTVWGRGRQMHTHPIHVMEFRAPFSSNDRSDAEFEAARPRNISVNL